ncbi:MAG: VanZ family protein [Oscillospiraceae bacterium]|nr:VanZ family protein [Oscillospiraceae bacterium]
MNKKIILAILILIVLLWCGIIFFFSSQNGVQSTGMSDYFITRLAELFCPDADPDILIRKYSFIVRKCAHFAVYAVLGGILLIAVNLIKHKLSLGKKYVIAVSATVFFAFTDEFHQYFTEGRSAQLSDVFIDSCGAFTGAAVVLLILYYIKKQSQKK